MKKQRQRRPGSSVARTMQPSQLAPRASRGVLEAGNAAVNELIEGIRIHKDAAARQEADSMGAQAFTRRGEVYLGSLAPPLDSIAGRELLSHEFEHVRQQRAFGNRDDGRVGRPGDGFERAADGVGPHPAGPPPGTQRQLANPKWLYGPQITAAVQEYLERVLEEQGGETLQITEMLKTRLITLAQSPNPQASGSDLKKAERGQKMADYLKSPRLMRSPAALAQDITPFLPHPMDPADLAQLKTTERKPLTKKGLARLPEIVQKTTPAKPKQNPEDEGTVPFYKSRQEEQFRTGQTGERTFSVPVGQILDVGREMAKPPQKKPQAQKKPEKKPAAEPDLVPDPNKSPKLPNLAHVTAVLTSALESAPKDKPAVDVRLEAEYGTLGEKDTAAVFSRLTEMLAVLRELRPELVRGVSKINVFFGAKLARTIPVAAEGKK